MALTLTRRIPGPLERIDSQPVYERWVAAAAGQDSARTEDVKRVLRVVSAGPRVGELAASTWRFGLGPTRRVILDGESAAPVVAPAA